MFDGAKATITIAADTSNELDPVDLTAAGLNGTLVVWTTDDLAGSWGVPDTYTITARTSSSVTIEVPVDLSRLGGEDGMQMGEGDHSAHGG